MTQLSLPRISLAAAILGVGLILSAALTAQSASANDISPPPRLAEPSRYLTNTEAVVVDGTLAQFRAFWAENPVTDFLKPTGRIPRIANVTVLEGVWGQPGSLRRVDFEDGGYTHERVLTNSDTEFTYQIWDISTASGRAINHIYGTFGFEELEGSQIRITWNYNIKPRIFLARGPIRRYLEDDFAPFMETGLSDWAAAFEVR
ncbi:MAG: hypothetical protein AAFV87_10660 [Pseudomonadota bacterium]